MNFVDCLHIVWAIGKYSNASQLELFWWERGGGVLGTKFQKISFNGGMKFYTEGEPDYPALVASFRWLRPQPYPGVPLE